MPAVLKKPCQAHWKCHCWMSPGKHCPGLVAFSGMLPSAPAPRIKLIQIEYYKPQGNSGKQRKLNAHFLVVALRFACQVKWLKGTRQQIRPESLDVATCPFLRWITQLSLPIHSCFRGSLACELNMYLGALLLLVPLPSAPRT